MGGRSGTREEYVGNVETREDATGTEEARMDVVENSGTREEYVGNVETRVDATGTAEARRTWLRAASRNCQLGREIAKNEIPSNSDRMKP